MAVGAKLNSFLTSYPHKKINCLRYISHVFGLPIDELTVDQLRNAIVTFADTNGVDDGCIKDTAEEFHKNPDECIAKFNGDAEEDTNSTSSHRISATDSDLADFDITDESDETGSTVTEDDTFQTGKDVSTTSELDNSLTRKVRGLLKLNSANKIVTEKNTRDDPVADGFPETLTIDSQSQDLFVDKSPKMPEVLQPNNDIEIFMTNLCTGLVRQVTEAKNNEIELLKQENEGLREVNETLSKNCSIILRRYEHLADAVAELNETASDVKQIKESVCDVQKQISELDSKVNARPNRQNGDVTSSEQEPTEWQKNCSEVLMDMATKIGSLEAKVDAQKQVDTDVQPQNTENDISGEHLREADILVIHDSNGNDLDPERLFPGKKVLKRRRYTLDKAKREKPKVKNPGQVKDVVIMTGLNDSRQKSELPEATLKKHKEVCEQYLKDFPDAHLHIAAVAPYTKNQIDLNAMLREYADSNEKYSFIDDDELFDRNTKKLRPYMLNGFHYTDHGLRTMAKSVRRSLYKQPHNSNRTHRSNAVGRPMRPSNNRENAPSAPYDPTMASALAELTRTTQAILQKVNCSN